MSNEVARELYESAARGHISKDALLKACLLTMSNDDLFDMALKHGFIGTHEMPCDEEIIIEKELENLDATQRIIERVLRRYGE